MRKSNNEKGNNLINVTINGTYHVGAYISKHRERHNKACKSQMHLLHINGR